MELGFRLAMERNLQLTDDVSLAEVCGHPVKVVMGCDELLKITTPIDLLVAKSLLAGYNSKPQLEKAMV
jgi:2-C-methyl-D-erythritol 4-phosphate cytidylyltransferase